ncbi:aspartate-alanine antiporter [Desulfovibrio sp.]|uniref:aspartate-alanine antiporter n=1 Tax=Desulfovibrio sp. TaxID=885 RepID=UPI0023C21E45|nr:aspartate-alanine antiporter [Desulfovibrio sp.]MDE7241067.1 aspartate-alanine antiporter [Desulfovibrio sp.]
MEWLAHIFRANPVIPIFLTLSIGFWLGQLKYKSFTLGPVAATLLVGVIIGQMQIEIPEIVRSIFFMLFLFSIGYSVGPQFFMAFKGHGLKQVAFALLEAVICASIVIIAARLMGYDMGVAAGLFAGSQTASGSLGLTSETIRGLMMDADQKAFLLSMIPASYAVTYVFGTIGSAWFLSNIGPMLLGGMTKVRKEIEEIEASMEDGEFQAEPGYMLAERAVSFRAYRAESDFFAHPRTVAEIEKEFADKGQRLFVERLRVKGEIRDPKPTLRVRKGDVVVLSGRREVIVDDGTTIGPEVADHELLSFGVENLPVTIARGKVAKMTFGELRQQPFMKGVVVRSLTRNGVSLPGRSKTLLQRGDVLTLVGLPTDVAEAVAEIGYSDRHTQATDMIFLGFGVALGCFVGALSVKIGGVPLSISTSGGTLLSGLFLGWLRNRRPSFGRIPSPVIWLFDKLGLNMFIAVIGLTSGATFIHALKEFGLGLFVTGIVCTLAGLTINIFIARKIFHFNAPETLGCVAGARCGVASIGAIQDALDSNLPAIGYSVTYAVANLVLVFSSLLVLAFA